MEYELYHHGILGQRWGNRNGPPYPLSSSDHSAAERKANKMLQRAYNTWTKLEKNQNKVGKLYAYRDSKRKQNIWQQKVNKINYKSTKLDHKIDKYLAKADKISAKSNLGKDYVYNVLRKETKRLQDDAGKKYKAFQAAERAKDPNEERLYKDYHRRLEEAGIMDDLAGREYIKRKKR